MPVPGLQELTAASSDVCPDLCSSALEQPDTAAAGACAHWLLAALRVGGFFY